MVSLLRTLPRDVDVDSCITNRSGHETFTGGVVTLTRPATRIGNGYLGLRSTLANETQMLTGMPGGSPILVMEGCPAHSQPHFVVPGSG